MVVVENFEEVEVNHEIVRRPMVKHKLSYAGAVTGYTTHRQPQTLWERTV